MKQFQTILGVALFFIAVNFSYAQEMKAEKYENPEWVSIVKIKFKPMKKEPAMGIINNYFVKADEDSGAPAPTTYHFPMGDYDMMVIWEMEDGLETLNWKTTPGDVKWMNSMAKIAGGPDKAMAKLDEFMSYVEKWDTSMARKE